jgi:hypothetical protein
MYQCHSAKLLALCRFVMLLLHQHQYAYGDVGRHLFKCAQ